MTRGPYARGRASRELILETALDVISHKGYGATSLKDIAQEVGMTQAGLLHHFGTKENLFAEVLQARDAQNRAALSGAEEHDLPLIVRLAHHNVQTPGLVKLYVNLAAAAGDPDHPIHGFFRDRYQTLVTRIAADIRRRQEEGRFRPDADPELVARTLFALSDGLQAQWVVDPTIDLPGILTAYWESFVPVAGRAR
jgi:beta-glucosidase